MGVGGIKVRVGRFYVDIEFEMRLRKVPVMGNHSRTKQTDPQE